MSWGTFSLFPIVLIQAWNKGMGQPEDTWRWPEAWASELSVCPVMIGAAQLLTGGGERQG